MKTFIESPSAVLNFTRVYYELTQQLSTEYKKQTRTTTKKNLHVLLADDDADDRVFLSEIIVDVAPRATIDVACNGAMLMEYMNSPHTLLPDIIFLDLNLPLKNGKQCLTEIKNDGKFQHIPVIIYSTSSYMKDIENAYNNGANLYVIKPNTCGELKRIMKKIFATDWSDSLWSPQREKFIMR